MTETGGDTQPLRERLGKMSPKERLSFLWYYYKWVVFAVIAGVLVLVFLVRNWWQAAHRNSVLNVTLISADALSVEEGIFDPFLATVPEMEGDESVTVDASLSIDPEKGDSLSAAAFQVLGAELLSGEIDVLISEETLFSMEQVNAGFSSLDEVMDPALLEKEADRLWWAKDPITQEKKPYGIVLTGTYLQDGMIYPAKSCLICGVASTTSDPELSGDFIVWYLSLR